MSTRVIAPVPGVEGKGQYCIPDSTIATDKKDFYQFPRYLEGSRIVQYSQLSSFNLLLTREGHSIRQELDEYESRNPDEKGNLDE
ncbi:MAG: hypothetical protein GY940_37975 [bacterium]|nr:hypothetical protein [bacterium]